MVEKTSQANSSSNNLPNIPAVAPTSDTPYIQPLIGKLGFDTEHPDIFGIGSSPDNGVSFHVWASFKGLVLDKDDMEAIWIHGVSDRVKSEVNSATAEIPAVESAADEAVKKADSAIASSKVNSDAIVAQSEAISEVKAAMDSATAEIQQTASNAASDAAKIRADVAQVQNEVDTAKAANSASVEALKSDISNAKQDLADVHDSLDKAQSAIEQNQKAINDSIAQINANVDATNQDLTGVRKDLTKAQSDITANQKVVNDNVAQINSNIEQDRKDIASAQQANADTAKQLDAYSKQAQEQGRTIKAVQDKQDGFMATLADVQGNVSQVSDKVDGLSASLKDAQDNVASVKAQADQLSAILTDHAKSIATLTASAKELSSTLEDADGRLSKVEQTAQTNSSTLSDVQGDLSQVKQNATKLVSTLKDAQGNISTLQQKADSVSTQLASAQGDIATLQTGVDSVKATLTDHDKSIHTLQADSKSLKDSMANAQGDISMLSKTATDVTSELEDHTGRLSKVEQTASKQETTLSDLQGNLSQVEQKADSNTTTISSINKNAMQDRGVITDTNTSFDSLTHLGTYSIKAIGLPKMPEQHYGTLAVSGSAGSGWISQQFVADTTGNVYTRVFSNNAWSAWKQGGSQDAINQVKQTADSNSATIRNVQGDVSTLKQTATGIKSTLASHEGDIHTLQADSKSLKDSMTNAQGDISTLQKSATSLDSEMKDHAGRLSKVEQTANTLTNEFSDQQGHLNRVEQTAQGTQQTVSNQQGQINTIKTDAAGIHETLTGQGNQIATINMTLTGLNSKYEGVSGDLSNLSNKAMQNRGTVNSPDFNSLTQAGYYTVTLPINGKNYPTGNWGTLEVSGQVSDINGRLNQKYVGDNDSGTYTRQYNATTKSWTAWIKTANQNDVTALSNRITNNSTQITQNKQAIALKADQSTVNNLSGEVSQAQAQLEVQADQISSKVSSTDFKALNDKVDGMKIGGRNLLQGTAKIEFPLNNNGGTQTIQKYDDETNYIQHTSNTPIYDMGPWWPFTPEVGKTYTLSADVCGNGYIPGGIFHYEGGEDGSLGRVDLTNDWQRISNTFRVNTIRGNWIIYANNSTLLKVKHIKIEKGNVATDWTPAPEDTITAIQKNTTAIDQTNQKISLKADQTEVDQVKNTASQNSSRLDVMAGQISSKVTATDVNNIVGGKGYATTSSVQSLIDQRAGTINESITKISKEFDTRNGVNMLTGTADFSGNNWFNKDTGWCTQEDWLPPEAKNKVYRDANHAWNGLGQAVNLDVGTYTFSMWIYTEFTGSQSMTIYAGDNQYGGTAQLNVTQGFSYSANQQQNAWIKARFYFTVTKAGIVVVRPELNQSSGIFHVASYKLEKGTNPNPVWTPAPSDNATVTQVQQITASIDGLQSTVANKADKSQITQLSNVIQSKVSSTDFNNLRKAVDLQTLDSADINNMKTNGHYFVHNLANNPIGSWVYVDVTGDGKYRIRQDVYQDSWNKHKFRRWYGDHWTNWEEGATYSEITQLQDAINLRVQKGELLSQINLTAHNTLIQSNKIYLDSSSTVFSGRAFIPSAAIVNLDADKITTGTLNGVHIHQIANANGRSIDIANGNIAIASNDPYEPRISFTNNGKDAKMFNAVGDIEVLNQEFALFNFTPEDTHSLNPIPFFKVTNTGQIGSGGAQLNMDHAIFDGYEWWTSAAGVTFGRTWNGVDKSSDYADIYAKSFVPHSELSAKTRIKKLDRKEALEKIMQDDMYTYQFKEDVRDGVSKRYASFIIDNIHDVAQYTEPEEFLSANGKGRDDGTQLAYLIAAVQYQQEQIEELKKKLEEK